MWLCQNCRKQSLYIGSAILGSWWSLLPSVLSLESKGYMLLAWSSLWVQGTYIGTGLQIESRQHRLEQHLSLGFALFKVRHSSQQVGGKNNGAKGTICCPLPVLGIISLWVTISINCLVQGPQAAPARGQPYNMAAIVGGSMESKETVVCITVSYFSSRLPLLPLLPLPPT